ncbi:MAG: glutathione S-transferase family protein [Phreatobacter sp.]|nr:glutathione S-transferase family protein [Phreatobacter sp.]
MSLRSAPASPFCQKVRMIIDHLGLWDEITIMPTDTGNPDPLFLSQNPLGKIPSLTLADGLVLVDSRVIAAYLDDLCGGGQIIPTDSSRFAVMRHEAVADGIMDAIVLTVYERRWRPEDRREPAWLAHQQGKIDRGLAEFERSCTVSLMPFPHVGDFALASALSYLDLRFEGVWRSKYPGLVAWLDRFSIQAPAFERTRMRPVAPPPASPRA